MEMHMIVPDSIRDPSHPSGGNVYDRRICEELAAQGWSIHEHAVAGNWPSPDAAACAAVHAVLRGLDPGAMVVIDGLIACAVPALPASARRLTLLVLVHMLIADERDDAEARAIEAATLSAASAVVATSAWTKSRLVERYGLEGARIHVVRPGVDAAELARGTAAGGALLCVAAVVPAKGHDVLASALGSVADLAWDCVCAGALDLDPEFVERVRRAALSGGIAERMRFIGTRVGPALDALYGAADAVVLCSRAETYGMVVTEALARGLPVITTAVGGVPEALGHGAGMSAPGLTVPPDDAIAVAEAVRAWLSDAQLRERLRRAAAERRTSLSRWADAAADLSDVFSTVVV
jgi:glycosyltransferase involved in cell wall biosynthesis